MTSYFRHAPVGGKQGGIQPECNQYRDSRLLFSTRGFISCCCKIQFSLCPAVHVMGKRDKKVLIKDRKEDDGGEELPSYDPISTVLLFSSEVVLRAPYFKSAPTDLRRRRCFTRRMLTFQRRQPLTTIVTSAAESSNRSLESCT